MPHSVKTWFRFTWKWFTGLHRRIKRFCASGKLNSVMCTYCQAKSNTKEKWNPYLTGSTTNYYRWLTDPRHTFLQQDRICFLCDNTKWAGTILFLAGIEIVAVRQWFIGQMIGKRKFLAMFFFCLKLHTYEQHTPITKIHKIRLDIGNCGYELHYNEHPFSDTPTLL